jgi:acyl-CoA thioesterase I
MKKRAILMLLFALPLLLLAFIAVRSEVAIDFVVGQFISSRAFYLGIALALLGCSLKSFFSQPKALTFARIITLAGVIILVLSAAPISFWAYGVFIALLAATAFRPAKGRWKNTRIEYLSLLLLAAQSLFMICTEFPHSLPPKIPFAKDDTLYVLGDSMSIGADPPGKSWPELLGELANLKVRNLSFGGAKVASSLGSVQQIKQGDALVILELGGNDLLDGTSIPKFRGDLDEMLALVCGPHRRVAMIELPLPPFYNRFGMVQRELAKSHGVTLIPKRYLANIICKPGATVDGLHLSNVGHALLAGELFQMLSQVP